MKQNVVKRLSEQPLPWLACDAPETVIAVSSRIRLARNLADHPFPGRADIKCRQKVLRTVCEAARNTPLLQPYCALEMQELDEIERNVLLERRLISPELCQQGI